MDQIVFDTRDDESTISCMNKDEDNEVYYICIEFPNLPALLHLALSLGL